MYLGIYSNRGVNPKYFLMLQFKTIVSLPHKKYILAFTTIRISP